MGCGASAEPTGFSPLAKAGLSYIACEFQSVSSSSLELFQCFRQVIQISDEQDEQDEVILLQLGAPVFRRTSNSSTEPLGDTSDSLASCHDKACFRQLFRYIRSRPP